MPYASTLCKRCHVRFLQAKCAGLCRRCFTNSTQPPKAPPGETYRRERARYLVKQAEESARLAKLRIVDTGPRPTRVITVQHREYEVVWDGA